MRLDKFLSKATELSRKDVKKISGKVSHTLEAERGDKPVAIIRIEQLYP